MVGLRTTRKAIATPTTEPTPDADADTAAAAIPPAEADPGTGAREEKLAREPHRALKALKVLGPGLISGASDDDPATIGTYTSIGAQLGFSTLWTQVFTFPLMVAVQYISAKVGLVTGMGLAGVLRRYYPRWLLYPVLLSLLVANTINAGADLGAMAAAINLLVPIPPAWLIVPVALLVLGLQVWGSYRLIERTFKWLALALVAYVGAGLLAKPDLGEVLRNTFLPPFKFDTALLTALVAISGTTFSPYLYFWQSSQEVEEEISTGRRRLWQRRGTTEQELTYAAWDVNVGMFASNLVTYFIILATGATLFKAGKNHIQTATDAAQALRPLAGDAAGLLLGVGLIGAGFLAVPVLTASAAYALSEAFGWPFGLDRRLARAKQFYAVIAVATVVGVAINFVGINPIDALFWTSIIYGFLAPPLLAVLMLVANSRTVMGERTNGRGLNVMGWLTTAVACAAAVGLVATWVLG